MYVDEVIQTLNGVSVDILEILPGQRTVDQLLPDYARQVQVDEVLGSDGAAHERAQELVHLHVHQRVRRGVQHPLLSVLS